MVGSGSMMFIPHCAKGQGLVMVVRSCASTFDKGACRWQGSHFLTLVTASERMVCQ